MPPNDPKSFKVELDNDFKLVIHPDKETGEFILEVSDDHDHLISTLSRHKAEELRDKLTTVLGTT